MLLLRDNRANQINRVLASVMSGFWLTGLNVSQVIAFTGSAQQSVHNNGLSALRNDPHHQGAQIGTVGYRAAFCVKGFDFFPFRVLSKLPVKRSSDRKRRAKMSTSLSTGLLVKQWLFRATTLQYTFWINLWFLINCPPTPPLSQHFALSGNKVLMLA